MAWCQSSAQPLVGGRMPVINVLGEKNKICGFKNTR